ncbi:LOW QUALITY PROTEIN: uncharacterized protein O3C94_011699 [Discoglossus pictus]
MSQEEGRLHFVEEEQQVREINYVRDSSDVSRTIPDLTPHIVRSNTLSLSQVPDASHSTPCERNRERNSVTSQASAIIRQQDRDKMVKQLIKFKPLFPHYDAKMDVLSNMSNLVSSVKQYMLSPKEACVMLKLWLPGALASRLEAPVSGPNDSNRDWFKEHKWGTEGDRLRAVCRLVTGNRDLDRHSLAEMRVTVQDDPWVFASKFEQVYRLTHRVPPDQTPSDMLQYLVRKFTYLDPSIQIMAEEKDTMEAVLCIIGKARQNILRKGVTGLRQIAIVTTNEGRLPSERVWPDTGSHSDLRKLVMDFPDMWAQHKNDCGILRDVEIKITGPDPPPQRQYRFPTEAIEPVTEIIDQLEQQGVMFFLQ